jgi:hypothetical protein
MLHGPCPVVAAVAVSMIACATPVLAQEHVTFQADVLVYGDNTEFRNPFREGATILGSAVRAAFDFDLADRVRVSLGAFGNVRFGSEDEFEEAKPVIALTVSGRRSLFVLGTLPPPHIGDPPGPDRTGPHGLLPPIQRETLAFDRPYEAGLEWRFHGSLVRHELWLNWQRVNTREHRERFDTGAAGAIQVSRLVAIPFQFHIVHEGGQLVASGPVTDSLALASGAIVKGSVWRLDSAALEAYGLASRFVPDRSTPERDQDGAAFFGRASGERAGWRGYIIVWRGFDYLKEEGDLNYLSVRRDGTRYRGTRDYAETGLSRTFRPASGVLFEASARLHRIEKYYEYSFRIVGTASFGVKIR